ncbi:MAG: Maf family protein [Desulfobacterales bacterium]|jgi:septum formation protein
MKLSVKNSGLILASTSPRRRDLLEQTGLKFTVIPSNLTEDSIPLSSPESYVKRLAEAKAKEISLRHRDSWVIGADTIVIINNTILGKPESRSDALKMLRSLSGKTHQVLTGYCICCAASGRLFSETIKTDVCFKTLTEVQIEWYLNSGEPFDKAGAYGIQGIGAFLVKHIHGSYTNVVGLPVCEVFEFLINEGVVVLEIDE